MRFCAVVGGYFGGDEVGLLRRTSAGWEPLGGGQGGDPGHRPLPDGDAAILEPGSVRIVQRLADGSDAGVILVRRGDRGPYSESDLNTLRLFLTVFERGTSTPGKPSRCMSAM